MSRHWRMSVIVIGELLLVATAARAVEGLIQSDDGSPIAGAFAGALTADRILDGFAISDKNGAFSIDTQTEISFLAIQPPDVPPVQGIRGYAFQPRVIDVRSAHGSLTVRLPPSAALVVRARTPSGKIMRWEDFEKGGTFGGVFLYATDLNDEMVEAVCWPVHDEESRALGSPREKGLPALCVRPEGKYVVQALFWNVPGYGNVLVRADNGGQGFFVKSAGETLVIDFEVELARTAVADLERRASIVPDRRVLQELQGRLTAITQESDPAKRSEDAYRLLADSLRFRDIYEVEHARQRMREVRHGRIHVVLNNKEQKPVSAATIRMKLRKPEFLFGVFEGSPFRSAPYKAAREAGFTLATVLPAWGWTDEAALGNKWGASDQILGISALRNMGFVVKAHGVLWLQEYGILPESKRSLAPEAFVSEAREHVRAMLNAWSDRIDLWEIMNEPATVNIINLPKNHVVQLIADVGALIQAIPEKRTLINSPHESDYGKKFLTFHLDGTPADKYPVTYRTFLRELQAHRAWKDIDIIGLQFYPGPRFNETLGGHVGPAFTLGWFVDTVERYRVFGKPIHITEMAVPSAVRSSDEQIAFWREPWTPQTQADYAEAIFMLAYATPEIESITYWEITDAKPSVYHGGILMKDDTPKPAYHRLHELIQTCTAAADVKTDDQGQAIASVPAGEYEVTTVLPSKKTLRANLVVRAGETTEIRLGE